MTFSYLHLFPLSSSSLHHHNTISTFHLSPPHSHSPPLYSMASNSLRPLHHHATPRRRRHSLDTTSALPSSLFLKTNTFPSLTFSLPSSTTTAAATSAASSAASTAATNPAISFDLLQEHLSAQNFREADDETRRLLIQLAGEAAQKRGYVFFSEVKFISEQDLQAIDTLWRQHSNDKYGYSVQRKIWKKVDKDFTKYFVKVGWMKKLESSEIEQYNYKAFPDEFFWEMTDDTPQGHLPLTNALRGTQLLTCILTHPAFQPENQEQDEDDDDRGGYQSNFTTTDKKVIKEAKSSLSNTVFKPDYSF